MEPNAVGRLANDILLSDIFSGSQKNLSQKTMYFQWVNDQKKSSNVSARDRTGGLPRVRRM